MRSRAGTDTLTGSLSSPLASGNDSGSATGVATRFEEGGSTIASVAASSAAAARVSAFLLAARLSDNAPTSLMGLDDADSVDTGDDVVHPLGSPKNRIVVAATPVTSDI